MENSKFSQMTDVSSSSEKIIKSDIMRYKRNTAASRFALLSLVFECLYFMVFYSFNYVNENKFVLGVSVVVNLFVLLMTFYAEEGIKNYNKKFSIMLLILAVVQFVRIFYYPLIIFGTAGSDYVYTTRFFFHNMGSTEFGILLIISLVLGTACLLASAVIGYINSVKLEKFTKAVDEGTISVENALKELDEKEEVAQEVTNA